MTRSSIITDVTTYISAQEYISSKLSKRFAEDPFALQSYGELIQTIFLYEDVYVPHPTKLNPTIADFGEGPELLIELMKKDIVKPLCFDSNQSTVIKSEEKKLLEWLQREGQEQLAIFLDSIPEESSFVTLKKLQAWCDYQYSKIRIGSHRQRIPTKDGIENDKLGRFVRAFCLVFLEKLSKFGKNQIEYLIATLLRSLRYRIRANVSNFQYQPHIIRRDITLRYNLNQCGISEDYTRCLIDFIQDIPKSISSKVSEATGVKLLNYNVPLLGGRLWDEEEIEIGNLRQWQEWIHLISERIKDYREKTRLIRNSALNIQDEEDVKKLEKDFKQVEEQLLYNYGNKKLSLTNTENELINGNLANLNSKTGFPQVSSLLITVESEEDMFLSNASTLQQLVYTELKGKTKYYINELVIKERRNKI